MEYSLLRRKRRGIFEYQVYLMERLGEGSGWHMVTERHLLLMEHSIQRNKQQEGKLGERAVICCLGHMRSTTFGQSCLSSI